MKVLSLWQPWASLIGRGKSIETRSWETTYRGPLAIHAAKRFDSEQREYCGRPMFYDILSAAGLVCWHVAPVHDLLADMEVLDMEVLAMPFGAVVAVCRLANIQPTDIIEGISLLEPADTRIYKYGIGISWQEYTFGNYAPGRFAWWLEDIHILDTPIPLKGAQGLFEADLPGLEGMLRPAEEAPGLFQQEPNGS